MTWGDSREREANLAALRDMQPTKQEQRIDDWCDQPDARVWQLAEKAAQDRQAPRELWQVRRLNKAMKASTMQMVFEDSRRITRQHTQDDLTAGLLSTQSNTGLGTIYIESLGGISTVEGDAAV